MRLLNDINVVLELIDIEQHCLNTVKAVKGDVGENCAVLLDFFFEKLTDNTVVKPFTFLKHTAEEAEERTLVTR